MTLNKEELVIVFLHKWQLYCVSIVHVMSEAHVVYYKSSFVSYCRAVVAGELGKEEGKS